MPWVKVLSSVPRNPKFQNAGPAASWLWLCGLCFCQDGLTDGYIPAASLDYLGVKGARRLADALVTAGLWNVAPGGWQIHDYLEHNRPAAEVRRLIDLRREAGELGGRASAEAKRKQHAANASSKRQANPEANVKHPFNPDQISTASASAVRNPNTAASPPFYRSSSINSHSPNGDNFHVIAALVREAITEGIPESDLIETIKVRASIRGIDYGRISGAYDVVTRAVASEWFKYTHPELVK